MKHDPEVDLINLLDKKIPNTQELKEIKSFLLANQSFVAFQKINKLKNQGLLCLTQAEEEVLKVFWFSIY